jgi:hypothetical protein
LAKQEESLGELLTDARDLFGRCVRGVAEVVEGFGEEVAGAEEVCGG